MDVAHGGEKVVLILDWSAVEPLLEEVEAVNFSYDNASNLINVSLKTSEERIYEISVFPKNLDLAIPERTE